MATPIAIGVGVTAAALGVRFAMRQWQQIPRVAGSQNLKKFYKGGFDDKMNRREALLILGLRETGLSKDKVKVAHRRIMLLNHPDRGGSPFLATKINEAKEFLEGKGRLR
ncbi:hypothetical protein SYNPS1DRAFT_29082 [Syncephalis pseudoplumigaleata]|uniref:Mitochondrial import inner membrane translocase subunit TIM14 n=1 Tax=Syncephalis pseudoplumigaleata TaxID=1712513 RepID=A0A4P9YYD9_9FUNG|nr:hypothetical protein SYNPS1DRAFT_29781 [Syncephalis pseudoplumigaleata]RKP25173.1 hypothetical protein SYNPS1DRAFT_29082 [Syncephalis pseudoplumigaleata]|eukprot:RKP24456.1 hypothetical protein SYNPS1DRAFT_29781 [Syncephalis pseudoplumigaleata]